MIFSVYIHKPIADILQCYGNLSDVINKMLEDGLSGSFDIMNKPNAGSRDGAARYDINIVNKEYLDLLNSFPINSSKISLRRLIYWFVENEMYEELSWEPVNEYHNSSNMKIVKKLDNISTELEKIKLQVSDDYKLNVSQLLIKLNNLKEQLKNGR